MKRILLITFLTIFCSGSIVNAQCAWVLWERVSESLTTKEKNWEPLNGFPTNNGCLKSKESQVRDLGNFFTEGDKKSGIKSVVKVNPGVNVIVSKESGFTIFEYRCLPDTIDPRK